MMKAAMIIYLLMFASILLILSNINTYWFCDQFCNPIEDKTNDMQELKRNFMSAELLLSSSLHGKRFISG